MVRQFRLKNSRNESESLNDELFGHTPEGLGIKISNEYLNTGSDLLLSNTNLDFQTAKINVIFGLNGNPYQDYYNFINFINVTPLTLEYTIPNVGVFSRDVRISELPKSEINEWHVIDEELSMEFLSPWYRWEEGSQPIYTDNQLYDGKIYAYNTVDEQATYVYAPAMLEAPMLETITIENENVGYVYEEENEFIHTGFYNIYNDSIYLDTSEASPLEVKITAGHDFIEGPIGWVLSDGVDIIASDNYFIGIPAYHSLLVSSDPHNQRAVLVDEQGNETNVYQYQDLTKSNFIKVPPGYYTLTANNRDLHISYRLKLERVVV